MPTPSDTGRSGLWSFVSNLVAALGMPGKLAVGLALDGDPVTKAHLAALATFDQLVQDAESLLVALGYRLVIHTGSEATALHRLGIDPVGYRRATSTLPLDIALTPVSAERVRKAFLHRIRITQSKRGNHKPVAVDALAQRVASSAQAAPVRFGDQVVKHAMASFPIILAAHEELKVSYLPLLCGCSRISQPLLWSGKRHLSFDRHTALLAHLGLELRLLGPGGTIRVVPSVASIGAVLDQVDRYDHQVARRQRRQPGPPRVQVPPSSRTGSSRLTEEEIIARLRRGNPPRDIATAAGVTTQRIYLIAREAGLSRRKTTAILGLQQLQELRRDD